MKRVSTEHRGELHFPLLLPLLFLFLLSACSAGPVRNSESRARADSLASATEQEFLKASFLAARGDHQAAIDAYRPLIARDPENGAFSFAVAREFLVLGRLDSARAYGERSLELDPSNRHTIGLVADVAHSMGEAKRALELYRRLAELDPGNAELLTWLAMEHMSAGEPEEALRVFRRVLRIDPTSETARSQVLLLEIRMRRFPEAISSLREMIAGGEDDGRLRLTLGGLYLRTGDYGDAAATFREALAAAPRFVPAWLALLEVSVRTSDTETFRSDLRSFYDALPTDAPKKLELARFYLAQASSDTLYHRPARLTLDEAVLRHPESAEALMLRGWVRMREGEPEGAVPDFRAAARLEPRSGDVREGLVTALLLARQYSPARRAARQAQLDLASEGLRFRVLEGYVLFESGRAAEAAPILERALRSPGIAGERELHLRALGTLAFSYDTLGLSLKSIPVYERLLVLDPENALVMNNLAYSLAEQGGDLERARRLAEGAVSKEPGSGVYLDTLGWILFREGSFSHARLRLERAAELEPEEPEILRHLAELYRAVGEEGLAAAAARRAGALEERRKAAGGR